MAKKLAKDSMRIADAPEQSAELISDIGTADQGIGDAPIGDFDPNAPIGDDDTSNAAIGDAPIGDFDPNAPIGDDVISDMPIGDESVADSAAAFDDNGPIADDLGLGSMLADAPGDGVGGNDQPVFRGGGKPEEMSSSGAGIKKAQFAPFSNGGGSPGSRGLDLLLDVELHVTVELGQADLPIKDVLAIGPGSIVELDKLAGDNVDVLVNGMLIAKGEVVVVDEKFGVRVSDVVSPAKRIQSLVQHEK